MSDRFPGQITIGGQVSRSAIPGLIFALHQDGASHDYGESVISLTCTPDELLEEYLEGETLCFRCDQATNGEFQETEQFCLNHDISYDRWSDHYCEFDAENAYYRPGMDGPRMTLADSDGNEIVDGDTVRRAMAMIDKLAANGLWGWEDEDGTTPEDVFSEAHRLLHDACPTLPDPLPKFQIIT